MPDQDLEPPRFSRKAFGRLLNDWPAVQCMIMSGVSETNNDQLFGDQAQISRQSGTALLDKFTHSLLVKCSAEMLDTLLATRIFVIFTIELAPNTTKRRNSASQASPRMKCCKVFQAPDPQVLSFSKSSLFNCFI